MLVSSAYTDLIEHREAVARQIQRHDMRFRGMEQFGVHPTLAPAGFIRQQAVRADVYIGVIGCRYGSVEAATQLSMTELEYHAAKAAGKPMLVYVAHDEALPPGGDGDADEDSGEKLDAFRERILADRVMHMFRSVEDLARQVYAALGDLREGD